MRPVLRKPPVANAENVDNFYRHRLAGRSGTLCGCPIKLFEARHGRPPASLRRIACRVVDELRMLNCRTTNKAFGNPIQAPLGNLLDTIERRGAAYLVRPRSVATTTLQTIGQDPCSVVGDVGT